MPDISVDRVVLEFLRERATLGDSYNTIIRKYLGLPAAPASANGTTTASARRGWPGALVPLIDSGKLAAGDTLTWHRPRRNETYTATVDAAGRRARHRGRRRVRHTGPLRHRDRGLPVQGLAQLAHVVREDPANRATSAIPPRPIACASAPSNSRHWRSFKCGLNKASLSASVSSSTTTPTQRTGHAPGDQVIHR